MCLNINLNGIVFCILYSFDKSSGEVLALKLGKEKWRKLAVIFDGTSISPEALLKWIKGYLPHAKDPKAESTNFQFNFLLKDGNGKFLGQM